jgi:hypothetical protein
MINIFLKNMNLILYIIDSKLDFKELFFFSFINFKFKNF